MQRPRPRGTTFPEIKSMKAQWWDIYGEIESKPEWVEKCK